VILAADPGTAGPAAAGTAGPAAPQRANTSHVQMHG
jgi:hypothetical protein